MTVVLGYDASPGAERALRVALAVSSAFGEHLVLVYGTAAPGDTGEEYRAHREAVREAGRSALARAVAAADEAGVPSTAEVVDEKPAQALLDAAERHGARVIIVGSWGDHPVRGALLGPTPHKLLNLSRIPVLCVPTEGDAAP
ncbi:MULTISPECIES: universal stress protein [unclassified Streptomyces]|uniref:universal stress protein n=1 Tax=unclassified Streptomyces TaxID=2593676 RepID=UPI001BE5D646|nr:MULTISPECIES: universal stress protein [unclassified Streptomyces]MBT2407801.1 universal stress protein [Streptomyces sp. ISL-21]MBT2456732.1 universal stress protein [Streptomyces sp. ISL-86]MBT2608509.1 universal stress protein [Streptomyces sp. ISL-87]